MFSRLIKVSTSRASRQNLLLNRSVFTKPGPDGGPHITPEEFCVVRKVRQFFEKNNFNEVYVQNRVNIMAACEDPKTVTSYTLNKQLWPSPQTGQMNLEVMLLQRPGLKRIHTLTTSYRDEKNPSPGRHDRVFPLYEFELEGGLEDLIKLEQEMMKYMGFPLPKGKTEYPILDYEAACAKYKVNEITEKEEAKMEEDYGPVVILHTFPMHTHPYWNMRLTPDGKAAKKIDVIVGGAETIGSAERAIDRKEMRHSFFHAADGYSDKLFELYGKDRTMAEVEEYLAFDFHVRSGGGIGMTRLIKALKKYGLFDRTVDEFMSKKN